jgi:hypothetical protein
MIAPDHRITAGATFADLVRGARPPASLEG